MLKFQTWRLYISIIIIILIIIIIILILIIIIIIVFVIFIWLIIAIWLKIITGNSDKMKKYVINIIKTHDFKYSDGHYYNRVYINVLNLIFQQVF